MASPFEVTTDKLLIEEALASLEPVEKPATRRAADVLVEILANQGVETVFGLPGGTIAPIYDALLDRPEIRVITTKHETSAMFAAAGYARTTGKLGVVLVTSGPGVTNALTGLASAWCDGIPVLLIAGEVSRKVMGKGALQEGSPYSLDMVGMTRRIAKLAVQVNEPNAAPAMLRRAITTAMSGRRGPVVVTLPIDVATAGIADNDLSMGVSTSFHLEGRAIERAARALSTAARPLIFAGSGCRWGEAPARLLEVAEKLGAPVMTTPKGKGVFPEDHPQSLGIFGVGGHPSALAYLERGVDVLLAIGTSLGELSTNGWSEQLLPRQELIHVDIDANQIGRCYPATLSIAGPAELFLEALEAVLPPRPAGPVFGLKRYSDPEREGADKPTLHPARALWEIQRALPADTIYTCDAGDHFVWTTHYLPVSRPDSFLVMTGLGSMGQSIGAAMGAKLARPDRTVAAICGDGCFAMVCGEIATAVAERLPILVFVMDDQRLGMVEKGNRLIYGRTPDYSTSPLDVPALARALGAEVRVARRPGDITAAELSAPRTGPLVVDIQIDRDARMPKNPRFEALGSAAGQGKKPRLLS